MFHEGTWSDRSKEHRGRDRGLFPFVFDPRWEYSRETKTIGNIASAKKTAPVDAELARLRAEVIEKMKESRASAEQLLAIHEEEKDQAHE